MIKVGDKVRLLKSKLTGFVADYIDDEMLLINVDGDEIPVFVDDMEFVTQDFVLPQKRVARTRGVNDPFLLEQSQQGVFVAFLPIKDRHGNILDFQCYLINNSHYTFLINFVFQQYNRDVYRWKNQVFPQHYYPLIKFEFDKLNDNPAVELNLWAKERVPGKEAHFRHFLRIKPQQFFKKQAPMPLMDDEGYVYLLFSELPDVVEKPVEDIAPQLQQLMQLEQFRVTESKRFNDFTEKANLPTEIDLHIEKLVQDYRKLTNFEIVQVQLRHFQQYLDNAIMAGLHRVFVIHGKGRGVLRDEIHRMLEQYPEVVGFNNDYHPRYGHGATEVILEAF